MARLRFAHVRQREPRESRQAGAGGKFAPTRKVGATHASVEIVSGDPPDRTQLSKPDRALEVYLIIQRDL
ncbi:MAG: hypothetical protein RIF32_07380 [Leptospirales bacterium]